jgi:hypothetical protein
METSLLQLVLAFSMAWELSVVAHMRQMNG